MFKNFQEQFVSTQESQHAAEFRLFNPRQDRLKLIISAILIPVGCSVFYFLLSGHKYAELKSAIGDIESVQTSESQVSQNSINHSVQATINNSQIQLTNTTKSEDQTSPDDSNNVEDSSTSSLSMQPLISETQSKPTLPAVSSALSDLDDALIKPETAEPTFETASLPAEEISPGRNLTELTELLIADDIFETHIDNAYQNSIPGRSQAEVAMLVTQVNDSTLQNDADEDVAQTTAIDTSAPGESNATNLHESNNNQFVNITNYSKNSARKLSSLSSEQDANEQDDLLVSSVPTSGHSHLLPALNYTDRVTRMASVMGINNTTSNTTDNEPAALEHRQHQLQKSKVILVDKIVGLLKSEVINPNATAYTGKHKLMNRHSGTIKKSFDIDKLESILEDI